MKYQRYDKVICKILKYIPKERSFEVEDVANHTRGWVIFVKHYQDIPPMREAYSSKKTVPLYFDRYEDGNALFTYRKYDDVDCSQTNITQQSSLSVNMMFTSDNSEFNSNLFEALYNSLGNLVDSEEKYLLAKQLISINRILKIRPSFNKDLFNISNGYYQSKFWFDGLLPYCSNLGIRKSWENADEGGKQVILQRLGISLFPTRSNSIECYFENIEDIVLNNIMSARSSIYACMAWFTNFNIFKAIRHKLEEGLKVILLTNNDLINNGGYCLNFNELIDKGLELHLAEYPDLIHHKFCVVDDQLLMTGSYNWTFFSENINRENIIVIKDDSEVIKKFTDEFNMLIEKYSSYDEMPESVPDKPEYDRSSFKQYISEELVLRSKKRIGNVKDNILRAKRLSPMYSSVLQAVSDFDVVEDNNSLSVEQIEQTVNAAAITERREQINVLNLRQQNLSEKRAEFEIARQQIVQQQEVVAAQAQQIEDDENVTEEERNVMQENFRIQVQELEQRQKQIESTINQVVQESATIEETVTQTEAQITAIQNTSQIATEGGRGSLKINLKWNTLDDLDLHVIDPDGIEIYYGSREHRCQNVLGKLDIDANAGNSTRTPQENIFWEEGKNAPLGRYKVFVIYFSKKDSCSSIPFTVTVYPDKGQPKVFTDTMYYAKEQKNVIEFDYTENGISYIEP